MPTTFTRYPVETERKDPGIGGKPPVDRRPTGGGGSGDDDEWHHSGRSGPRELLKRFRMIIFFGLAGDMMFFLALSVMFFAHQGTGHFDARTREFIGDWHPVQIPPILFLNTAVLLLSSLTMEIARRNIFREFDVVEEWLGLGRPALYRTLPWLGGTLILGGLFIAGQWMAWTQLTVQGFAFDRWSTPASYFFYLITGVHAAHLVLGLLALVGCLSALGFLRKVEYRQIAVDSVTWYWHAMGLAWLLLFTLLALD
ncbi:cytochrome c oxidase subunit 3 family protein [Acidicapsa ligni]|uniref:heme-copper oxidase subunit III n=1 Tax=Acidicapsa ligni TaxID=542300 RepID=UPI0021DF42E6|nr:heme-copper oxidase subunit III [Acidicapsa ligni]